jgi:hypothetical protein
MRKLFPCLVVVAFLSILGNAQTSTTSVRGTISDPKGAVVPNATVTVTNVATGMSRTVSSSSLGAYQVLQLPPGEYTISVTAPGFGKVEAKNVRLLVATPGTVDFSLKVAEATTTVEVTGETPMVNTQDATLGSAFNSQQVTSLPMEGRDPVSILSLQPGVTWVGNNVNQTYDSRGGAVNGARSDQSNVTLDGIDNNDQVSGYAFQGALRPTLDSLQEFRVTTSSANADAGRSSGAQVVLVTKSGTNAFHGSIYEYNRPTVTTANDWFNKKSQLDAGLQNRPGKLIRNTFGAAVGGPIIKDKLFFFATYEGQRSAETTQVTRTVPSMALRNGIIQYYDTGDNVVSLTPAQFASMDPNCSGNGTCPWGPGADPNVLAVLNSYPQPNALNAGDGLNYQGYTFAAPTPSSLNTYIAKLDWNASNNNHIFIRGNLQNDTFVPSSPDAAAQFPGQPPNESDSATNKGVAVGWTSVLRPTLVNNFRYGFIRQGLGFKGLQTAPVVYFRGLDTPTGYTTTHTVKVPVHNFADDVTWTKGTHTIQFGGTWRLVTDDRTSNRTSYFFASTNPSWTDNAAIANTGGSLDPAAFGFPTVSDSFQQAYDLSAATLAGIVPEVDSSYNRDKQGNIIPQGTPISRQFRANEMEFYVQDSWRMRPNLTITAGVRYTLLQPPYERNGLQASPTMSLNDYFNRRKAAMEQGQTYDPLITADLSGQANGKPPLWEWDHGDIAPRFAFAWSPEFGKDGFLHRLVGGNSKTVIRGGYGMYYDHFGQGIISTFDTQGAFGLTTLLTNSAGIQSVDTAPRFTGINDIPSSLIIPGPAGPFPFTPPTDPNLGGFAITWGLDNKLKTPYAHVFNLSLERELPAGFLLEASYVGRVGHRLLQEEDLAMPLDIRDPASGMDYFTAATDLAKMYDAGTDINSVAPMPYWENLFPAAAGLSSVQTEGCAPGTPPTNVTATQAMYDLFACFRGNETTALFVADLYCYPACSTLGPYAYYAKQYSSLYAWRSIGNSSYNGAQLSLRHRGKGLQFDFNYTFSKSIDVGSNAERISLFEGFGFASQIINSWSPKQLRAVSDFDARHQINANWVWDVPVGRGKRWGSGFNSVAEALIGGWEFSGLMRYTSPLPFTVEPGLGFWSTNWELTSAAVVAGTRPRTGLRIDANGIPNVFLDPSTAASAFRFAYPGESGQRNNLRGPGFFGLDAGLSKTWKLREGMDLKFSWEAFNIFNHPSFDVGSFQYVGNNSFTGGSSFGELTQTASKPRSMQFALRLSF